MRILSWLGALAIVAVVGVGTTQIVRTQHHADAALTASAAAGPAVVAEAGDPPHSLPVQESAPSPRPHHAPAPAPKAAPVTRSAAAPPITIGSYQQTLINKDRVAHGLRPLSWSSCLATIARSNAVRISYQGKNISHTNGPTRDLGCHLGYHAGENIGWYSAGINDTWANNAFMASPDHRANILSPYYHYVATSWVKGANGYGYIAVEFS